jgi:hypothetical protein
VCPVIEDVEHGTIVRYRESKIEVRPPIPFSFRERPYNRSGDDSLVGGSKAERPIPQPLTILNSEHLVSIHRRCRTSHVTPAASADIGGVERSQAGERLKGDDGAYGEVVEPAVPQITSAKGVQLAILALDDPCRARRVQLSNAPGHDVGIVTAGTPDDVRIAYPSCGNLLPYRWEH